MTTARPYKILVAVAFESTSDVALHEAMNLAVKSAGAELHVVHVLADVTGAEHRFEATPEQIGEATDLLRKRIEAAWQQAGEIKAVAHLRTGDAADSILRVATEIQADVIVAGSHRRKGLQKLVLGSVAERVLHESHCPVLIAVPKAYAASSTSAHIEPACDECLKARAKTAGATFWCERHSRAQVHSHIYVPRDTARSSVFPTY
jgi:nucleotide-binding universal stress UspA family protein